MSFPSPASAFVLSLSLRLSDLSPVLFLKPQIPRSLLRILQLTKVAQEYELIYREILKAELK